MKNDKIVNAYDNAAPGSEVQARIWRRIELEAKRSTKKAIAPVREQSSLDKNDITILEAKKERPILRWAGVAAACVALTVSVLAGGKLLNRYHLDPDASEHNPGNSGQAVSTSESTVELTETEAPAIITEPVISTDPHTAQIVSQSNTREADAWGECGDHLSWYFYADSGLLAVEGSGDMWDFGDLTDVPVPWYQYKARITEISLPEGLTSIGESAFMDTFISSVTIPSTVTRIGIAAFFGCNGINSVELPEGLQYLAGFGYCENLSSITIPEHVTVIGAKAFCCCPLTSVIIPESVTEVQYAAFRDCSELYHLTVPDTLATIEKEAFKNCPGVIEISVAPGASTVGDNAFNGCTNLMRVILPEGIKTIEEGAFAGCYNLREINLPNSLVSLGDEAFTGCSALKDLEIPDGVEIGWHTLPANWD